MTKIFNCNKYKSLRPALRFSLTKGETIFWKYIKSDLESIGLKVIRYTSEQAIRHIRDTIDNLAWICNDRTEELKKVSSSF